MSAKQPCHLRRSGKFPRRKGGSRGGGTNYKKSVSVGEFFKMVENGVFRDGEEFYIVTPNKTIWYIHEDTLRVPLEGIFEYGGITDHTSNMRTKIGNEYFQPYASVKVRKVADKFVVTPVGIYDHTYEYDDNYYTYHTTKRTSKRYSPRSSKQWIQDHNGSLVRNVDVTDMRVVGMGVNDAVDVQDLALVSQNATRKVNRHNPASRVLGNRDLARDIAQYLSPASDTAVKTGHRKTAKRSQSKSPPKKGSPSIDELADDMKDLMKSK